MGDRRQLVDRAAIGLSVAALSIGVLVPVLARFDSGVQLSVDEAQGRLYVEAVEPLSPAADQGVRPGMVAVAVNDIQVIRMPEFVYPDVSQDVTANPATGEYPDPSPVIDPPAPVQLVTGVDQLHAIAAQPVRSVMVIAPENLVAYDPNEGYATWFGDDGRYSLVASLMVVVFGIAILFSVAWWLLSGRTGLGLQDLALPLALATASPFLLDPLRHLWHPAALATLSVLLPATMLPLAFALVARIAGEQDRRLVLAGIAVCAIGAIVTGLGRDLWAGYADIGSATGILTAGITVVPGFIAAGPALTTANPVPAWSHAGTATTIDDTAPYGLAPSSAVVTGTGASASGRVLQSAELAIAGFTPAAALLTAPSGAPWLFLVWVGAIAAAGRFTVRPLARLASRAQLQRDLVVAATEAERARVAADIHDDALQELTLLVRRLDAAGDTEGAEIARTVSDRLRAICGDLRLPILDDLGVGPALDWLVLRIERLAGGEVRLERADGNRPPPDVELAIFRIAQEALSNAVKHGSPPILVRYRATEGAASLSIDDAGSGIPSDAGERAEHDGRFGLLNMQQRAEGIGAILDVRRWPTGGTHVQLEWRAR